MKARFCTSAILSVCMLTIGMSTAWANWILDGVALCTATANQSYPAIISDSDGGAIVVWTDTRNGSQDLYAQRVNSLGVPQWTANGIAIATATGTTQPAVVIPDGAGGAIAVWTDYRSGSGDIYAQRVNAAGITQWTAGGVAICAATGNQSSPDVVTDGTGGAVVTWTDGRNSSLDIYCQRVNASGEIRWTSGGLAICTAAGDQEFPRAAPNGSGGAIIAWSDSRSGGRDIYVAQAFAPGYVVPTNGSAICTASGDQLLPFIAPDGSGGAFISWSDSRSVTISDPDIYAQRVNSSLAAQWTANGKLISATFEYLSYVQVVPDGTGGAIVGWRSSVGGLGSDAYRIYVQRLSGAGALTWTDNGVLLTDQAFIGGPQVVPDGAGGAIVSWSGDVNYSAIQRGIYTVRLSAAGAFSWGPTNNCTAPDGHVSAVAASDGNGGAIVAWRDYRNGPSDIYAQLIDVSGRAGYLAPDIQAVRDVPGDQGGQVYLSWNSARADRFMDGSMSHYSIWRAIGATMMARAAEKGATILDSSSSFDVTPGHEVIRIQATAGRIFYWELVQTINAAYMPAYGQPVATLFDSTAVSSEYQYFQVLAHSTIPAVFWASDPDSGRSVDNLAPPQPASFSGRFSGGTTALTWAKSRARDLSAYWLYRGETIDFTPNPSNFVAARSDTSYVDQVAGTHVYKLAAIDVHGNLSPFATLTPQQTSPVPNAAPLTLHLYPCQPNPFNPMTTIRYELPDAGVVRLSVYDVAGRLVRTLVDESMPQGAQVAVWNGRDESGREVGSGTYLARLEFGGNLAVVRMGLVR